MKSPQRYGEAREGVRASARRVDGRDRRTPVDLRRVLFIVKQLDEGDVARQNTAWFLRAYTETLVSEAHDLRERAQALRRANEERRARSPSRRAREEI